MISFSTILIIGIGILFAFVILYVLNKYFEWDWNFADVLAAFGVIVPLGIILYHIADVLNFNHPLIGMVIFFIGSFILGLLYIRFVPKTFQYFFDENFNAIMIGLCVILVIGAAVREFFFSS